MFLIARFRSGNIGQLCFLLSELKLLDLHVYQATQTVYQQVTLFQPNLYVTANTTISPTLIQPVIISAIK